MAYYEVFSPACIGSYNRKLARLTTLTTAVYWSEVLDIISHVVKKKKFDKDGYFKLDRDYIERQTSITLVDQLDSDSMLVNIGVLDIDADDANKIRVNLEAMEQLLIDDKAKTLKTSKTKVSKAQAARNKQEAIILNMKRCIGNVDEQLKPKYEAWVDSVYAAGRFLTKVKIQAFQDAINNFTTDAQIKLNLLDIGIRTGWDCAEWVLNKYTGNNKNNVSTLPPQKISTELATDVTF